MIYSIEEIINTLKKARKKLGLSQRALSAKIGIPQSHLSKIEAGQVDLQVSSLIQQARALDLEVILVPKKLKTAVKALELHQLSKNKESLPAYRLDEE